MHLYILYNTMYILTFFRSLALKDTKNHLFWACKRFLWYWGFLCLKKERKIWNGLKKNFCFETLISDVNCMMSFSCLQGIFWALLKIVNAVDTCLVYRLFTWQRAYESIVWAALNERVSYVKLYYSSPYCLSEVGCRKNIYFWAYFLSF